MTSVIALYAVLSSENSDGPSTKKTSSGSAQPANTAGAKPKRSPGKKTRSYTVKPGDTPSGIADKTGVDLDTLLELNPDLDPQLLSPGQRLKLPS